jgi:membrane protease YdiL (CAAX protease family)
MKARYALKRLGIMVLGMVLFLVVLGIVQMPMHRARLPDLAAAAMLLAIALVFYVAYERFVERRIPTELAPGALLPEGAFGLAAGFALFAVTIGVLALAGAYHIYAGGPWTAGISIFFVMLAGAVIEELLFRGFLFRTIRELFGTWAGVAVSAVLFGAAHAFNPGASVVSTVAIALEAGVLLSLAYAATNRLWVPIGLHAAWNFSESFIFGTAVSGHATTHALFYANLQGPALLTGGAFGPEASIVAVLVCLAGAAVFATRVRAHA